MLECSCGTVAVPLSKTLPRGWTLKGDGKCFCPLCSMVEAARKHKENALQ